MAGGMVFDRSHYTAPLIGLVAAAGLAACLHSAHALSLALLDLQLLFLVFLTVVVGPRVRVKIPTLSSQITTSDAFIFLTLLVYGWEAAVLLAAFEGLVSSLRFSRKKVNIAFNASVMPCSTYVTATVLELWFGPVEAIPHQSAGTLAAAVCVMALAQYAVNTTLVAALVASRLDQPLWRVWRRHYLWTSITYIAGAVAAGLIARLIETYGFTSILISTPIVAVVYFTYQTYLKTVENKAAQAEQAERHVQELSLYIEERRRAEEALRESEEKYRLLIENVPGVVWTADREGRYLFTSRDHSKGAGATQAAPALKTDPIHPDDVEMVRAAYAVLFSEEKSFDVEYRAQGPDGAWVWLHDKAVGTYERDGVTYADGLCSDVTQRKALETQLRQAQKLESIGQLAAGIAHEINTPTQYVGDNARFLDDAFRDISGLLNEYAGLAEAGRQGTLTAQLLADVEEAVAAADIEYLMSEVPRAIRQALEGVERIAKIVQSMKEFAHPGAAEKQSVDLNRAIESTITIAQNEWKYVAEMEMDFDHALTPVPCLLGEFNQVILNMIINAAHAVADVVGDGSRGKGQIRIATRLAGEWAEVRVSDTGTGIPEWARAKVFDPFFTTKEVGKGTGQGLAISHTVVVERHGGRLTFETRDGVGTTFIIHLPLHPEEAA